MKSFLVQQYMEPSLRDNPGGIAVMDGKEQYSYQELELLSNRLAHCLLESGVTRQSCVVFCMQRSVHCLVAILGTLKADGIYVPIDHKAPIERIQKIIKDCQPKALICDPSTHAKFFPGGPALTETDIPIISLGNVNGLKPDLPVMYNMDDICSFPEHRPQYANRDSDTAYILYTSGSTGKPKGVMTSHGNINSYIEWAVEYLDIGGDDKILGTAPFHFDMSTFDIYSALKTGATLCVAQDGLLLFPELLLRFMEKEEVTLWKGVSSLLMYIERAGILGRDRIPAVKKILFGGEKLSAKYLIRWMETYPDKLFYNAYGPTEATGISLCYKVPEIPKSAGEKIPIGKPCKDKVVVLVKEDNTIAQPGEIGELYIAGAGVSKGYLNDPGKTEEAFVDNIFNGGGGGKIYKTGDLGLLRADGNYEFIDRKDNQVKFLGYRIELCEIEHALLSISEIKDAAVQLMQSAHEGLSELVAFYESEESIAAPEILAVLEENLPKYMLPRQLIQVNFIPRNERGKICRVSLRSSYPLLNRQDGKNCATKREYISNAG